MQNYQLRFFVLGILVWFALSTQAKSEVTLVPMDDSELAQIQGQALMNLSYIAPTDPANLERKRDPNSNIGFYKLGLEADLELNVNIKKLQLGCGGANGAGNCDIDIDNLSLSGLGNSATSNTDTAIDRNARAGSSAVLTNPFIQFAIKNPNTAATRQVVGINLSAEKAIGLITFGTENTGQPNGINSLSGYMQVAPTTGTALVNGYGTSLVSGEEARGQLKQSDGYNAISGNACCLLFAGNLPFKTTSYNLNLRDQETGSNILKGDLILKQQPITGKRINTAVLQASAVVHNIDLSGNIVAQVAGLLNLNKQATGTIKNLTVDATINEGLGFFHKASLNGTAASLSLQSQDIQWTQGVSVAQKGWWLEFSNPIDIGKIDPSLKVDIPQSTLNEVMTQVGDYLTNKQPVDCGAILAINCLAGNTIPVGTVDLEHAPHASMTLNNLQLAKQGFTPNCYGNLKFC
ncbi:hypothetical protein IAE19_11205 [Acinetobacter sp. S40]|uniref:hypothetical protein n=1 Tax=unclassified Acinetobacter TaxID=196816 RepID=UPI00190BB5F5|nr:MULTISPECIES: hypothetical protein [unclassified Acinetobacter]MBJ9986002.1 hypothetical protein [Acinetobacter sp. S40]MBK0063919.1 hypothetical protein [Acinetobacter sp. S55]MBK0067204.1 hypothetical protein [Acinetobacter sp. S54]